MTAIVIGLTGGICSGKSTVCGFLADLGADILSADEIGHQAYEPSQAAWRMVVDAFGDDIVREDGQIDRQKLGEIVFHDPEARARLNQIMHPVMHQIAQDRIEELKRKGSGVIVLEAPLLIEANWLDLVDRVWVVTAGEQEVIRRCSSRSDLSEAQARARIASQLPMSERLKYADQVVSTDGTLEEVRSRVLQLWNRLCLGELTKEGIRTALSRRKKIACPPEGRTPAAVLIPLFDSGGRCHILFTKRTETVDHHKGQISFPGGGRQWEDSGLHDTALREAWEEIGLDPEQVEILGELDDAATYTSGFVISPFVACIPYPYKFVVNPDEVEELISVPLEVLLDKANFREEPVSIDGIPVQQYYYQYGDKVIWGATARILKQFLDVVFGPP